MTTVLAPRLFEVHQHELTSDDYYTPAWVFERMGLTFDLDVCSPPGGIPWIPAARFFDMADDGLAQPWEGRVWMNPPFSGNRNQGRALFGMDAWVQKFVDHRHGVALLPFSRSRWCLRVWNEVDAVSFGQSFPFVHGDGMEYIFMPVQFAAFGDECVEAIARLGRVRR